MSRTHRRYAPFIAAVVSILMALAFAPAAPANAAPPAPSGLDDTGELFPVLSWDHIDGVTQYQLELSKTKDSTGVFGGTRTTSNRQYVPVDPLPWTTDAPLYWRVAAKTPFAGDWSEWTAVTSSSAYAAPRVTSPTPGQEPFEQPAHPATLSWDPVEGAQEYEVEISQDKDFTDPALITTKRTVSTTYVVSDPQVATTYWFRVRARLSTSTSPGVAVYTDRSAPVSYEVTDLEPAVRVSPEFDSTVVDDAVFDWNPVDGARTYDIQVATDPSFGSIVNQATGITGTSYARPKTLDNDTYWWRVRATDVAGNVQAWNTRPTWKFDRAWPELPMPSHPANPADLNPANPNDADAGVQVGDPFYYEWEPVRFASMYKLELATDANFSTVVGTCFTRNTTYTPGSGVKASCMPGAEATYWWRVSAMDQHRSVQWTPLQFPTTSQNVFHDARFTYRPTRITPVSPTDGATIDVPTMTWQPLQGAARYHISIVSLASGSEVDNADTAATSYTPAKILSPGTYRWDVYPLSEDGRKGSSLLPGSQRTFTLVAPPAATATHPTIITPQTGEFGRFPALSWASVDGATSYKVWVRIAGGTGWTALAPDFKYPAATDTGTNFLAPGAYDWMVDANTPGGVQNSGIGHFDIANPATVTGEVNALSMAASEAGQTCTGFECTDLRQTPVLTWDPEPGTGYYRLWISRNANLSNLVPPSELGTTNPVPVYGTSWMPTTTLQESTAGEAYYWAVQPCTADGKCASNPVPHNSFNKASNPVESVSPGTTVGALEETPVVADDVTLEWRDYLATNEAAAQGSSQLSTKSRQEAREYEVQVSADPTFASLLDQEFVDQRKFTSFDTTYPEGNIYWRVRAIDGFGNPLPWSDVRVFKKESPTPVLDSTPGVLPSAPVLSWQPLPFAASYQLEISAAGSTAPLLTTSSNQVKWSPTTAAQTLAPGAYKWRVRRVDAKGRFGGWSALSNFTVGGAPVGLVAPANGGAVAPRDSLFRWSPENRAADYRVTLVAPGGSQSVQTTKATSWAPTSQLAAGTWTWHVETRDSAGKVIARSATQGFSVTPDLAATSAPRIDGSGQLDTVLLAQPPVWNHQPDSVTYQWFRGATPVGDGTLSYTVTTADLGQRIAIKATGKKLGYPDSTSTSNAISGVQGAAPVAVTPPTIGGTGFIGETLTGNLPKWSAPDVTMTYRWLIGTSSVSTAATYAPRAGDLGKAIVFEVTGKRTNYATAIVTSAPLTVLAGGALQATGQPVITGTPASGSTLRAEPGTWSQPSPTFRYQWLRNGAPIPSATGSSYRLTPDDAGTNVAVTVLASKTGFNDGSANAAAVPVARLQSKTEGTLKSSRVKVGKRAKVTVTVAVSGLTTPTGVVQVLDKGKKVASFTMAPVHKGTKTLKLKKLKKGKHKLQVVYLGNAQTFGSKSKRIILYVVKK